MNTSDPLARPRRFYGAVETAVFDDGVRILLDGRNARTPKGAVIALPTPALADLVASEWAAQGETLDLQGMVATRLARTVIDGGETAAEAAREVVLRHGASDLVCYFAEAPQTLVRRQEAVWGPLLAWANTEWGLDFVRAEGIVHRRQSEATLARLAELMALEDPYALVGLGLAAGLFGSAVVAMALRAGRLDAAGAMEAARIDEVFQEEHWGVDEEAASRTAAMARDATVLEQWFGAIPSPLVRAGT
ncbi:MAG TPA: ATP12 family protein [Caulobacteraceae bacterium]|jgi:chaperone required for assembly of F1-ATPase|nr:ATP12 family protein [Caulobacteraceae bacterium]